MAESAKSSVVLASPQQTEASPQVRAAGARHVPIEFAEQAQNWPDRIAISADGPCVTYGMLDNVSDRVAAHLRSRGVRPEDRVMVHLQRSTELICVLLGVLKSGAAYVPVDTDCPSARLALLLDDANPRIYIGHADRLPTGSTVQVLSLEDCLSEGTCQSNGVCPAEAANLAYMIYTSGSTGEPKAVMVTHQGLGNYVEWAIAAYGFGGGKTSPLHTSVAFDLAITSIFPALLAGDTIQIVVADGIDAVRTLSSTGGYSVVKLTPSHLTVLSELMDESAVAGFARMLVVGGEAFPESAVASWRKHAPATVVINEYGPTETVVGCTWQTIGPEDHWSAGVPIGRPIAGATVFVLNDAMDSVPVGSDGELYIGGVGVARGYRNRAALTADRFVPNPFSSIAGDRLYCSGDRVRLLPDSSLLFLSRLDDQLKVRGHRIEPGEIEAALQQFPSVQRAVVVLRQMDADENALVAYIQATESIPPSVLRQHLGKHLPQYMIPSLFVPVARLPLSASGKIDRRALPAPEASSQPDRGRKPSGPVAMALASLWCELLRLEDVTLDDNFFELGGDSILAIRLAAKARQHNIKLTPRLILENPTIARLAAVAAPLAQEQEVAGSPTERRLSPAQLRFFERHTEISGPVQRVLLDAPAEATASDARNLIQVLLQRHESLRSRFEADKTWRVVIEPENSLQEWFFVAAHPDRDSESLLHDFAVDIDPRRAPLLRALWIPEDAGRRARLLIAVHHLAIDGVSWRILLDELGVSWHNLHARTSTSLPPPTCPLGAWAVALGNRLTEPAIQTQAWYWLSQNRPVNSVAVDDGLAGEPGTAGSIGFYLTEQQTTSLIGRYPGHLQDVILAAVVQSIQGLTTEPVIQVEIERHGREDLEHIPDVSRTIGWFTSFFPVSIPIMRGELKLQIAAVQGTLNQVPDQGFYFGVLQYLSADTELRDAFKRLPDGDVGFNFLGSFEERAKQEERWIPAMDQSVCASAPSLDSHRSFEILASIHAGRLRVDWQFHRRRHRTSTVERLARLMRESLETLAPPAEAISETQLKKTAITAQEFEQLRGVIGDTALTNAEEVMPATPLQQGMLFESLRSPRAGFYAEQYEFDLSGASDPSPCLRVWRSLIHREPILRSAFAWEGLDRPLMIVFKDVPMDIREFDCSLLPEPEQLKRLAAYIEEDRSTPFDLWKPPLMRMALFRWAIDRWRLVWTHHHILLDGWSNTLLRQDFLGYYLGRNMDDHAVSRPRFGDFVTWLESRDYAEDDRFWAEYLHNIASATPLPFPVLNVDAASSYEEQSLFLTFELTERIKSFAKRSHLSLSAIVASAWGMLLSRCTCRTEVVLGTVMSLRGAPVPGIERMIGPLFNTVPVRICVPESLDVPAWLRSVQGDFARVQEHAHVPLTRIQALSPLPAGVPLFETLFTWENNEAAASSPVKLEDSSVPLREMNVRERVHYPLALVAGAGEQLNVRIMYDSGRIERSCAERLLERLVLVLDGLMENRSLAGIHVCTPDEYSLIRAWSEPTMGDEPAPYFHEQVEEIARELPDMIAVASGRDHLSYATLHQRTLQISGELAAVAPCVERPVILFFDAGLHLLESALAVLKSGAAFIQLEPGASAEQCESVISASNPRVILTDTWSAARLASSDVHVLEVDRQSANFRSVPKNEAIHGPVSFASTACISHAPDATAIAIPHRSLANVARCLSREVKQGLRCLHSAPLASDAGLLEVLVAWAAGATVVSAPGAWHGNASELVDFIAEQQIERGVFAPAAIQRLFESISDLPGTIDSMRDIVCAGELPAPPPAMRAFFETRPSCRLTAYHGSAETQLATEHRLEGKPADWVGYFSMGAPACGAITYVLDSSLNFAPIKALGELWIGGANLSNGHLGRPGLTADALIPDPFARVPGMRMCKTGKLVAWEPSGKLVSPERRAAWETVPGPEVDRHAQRSPSPPRTAAERLICRVWANVLGVAEVGMKDDFLSLGGHSLTAVRLISVLSQVLRLKLSLQMILDNPTVEVFLELVSRERGGRKIVEDIAKIIEDHATSDGPQPAW